MNNKGHKMNFKLIFLVLSFNLIHAGGTSVIGSDFRAINNNIAQSGGTSVIGGDLSLTNYPFVSSTQEDNQFKVISIPRDISLNLSSEPTYDSITDHWFIKTASRNIAIDKYEGIISYEEKKILAEDRATLLLLSNFEDAKLSNEETYPFISEDF